MDSLQTVQMIGRARRSFNDDMYYIKEDMTNMIYRRYYEYKSDAKWHKWRLSTQPQDHFKNNSELFEVE